MKKFFSAILALMLLFSCAAANAVSPAYVPEASAAGAASFINEEDELSLFPSSMILPMFSSSSGERLRVFAGGEAVPAELFIWESSDPGIVEVTQSGRLTAVSPGTAIISISDGDGGTAHAEITVVRDEEFATIGDLESTPLPMPFYSEEVGIGPLCGAEPVILKRFRNPPSCGDEPEPDPNALIASEGWTYTYAVVYRFHVHDGQSFRFITSPSTAPGAHASSAYICVYGPGEYLWDYNCGNSADPFGDLTVSFYEDADFYLVITPLSHTDDDSSGNICLYAYDLTQPYQQGDVDMDHYLTSYDALTVLRAAMGLADISDESALLADIGGDGAIGSDDALCILRVALGLDDVRK